MSIETALTELRYYIQKERENNIILPEHLRRSKIPTMQEVMSTRGYDWAKEHNVLEPYMDSLGPNFLRSKDAWEKNWSHIFK